MDGFYYDPQHGGCLRRLRKIGHDMYAIDGVYGGDETPLTGEPWSGTLRVVHSAQDGRRLTLSVDLSSKTFIPETRRKSFGAHWDARRRAIRWDDGVHWRKLYAHSTQFKSLDQNKPETEKKPHSGSVTTRESDESHSK